MMYNSITLASFQNDLQRPESAFIRGQCVGVTKNIEFLKLEAQPALLQNASHCGISLSILSIFFDIVKTTSY